MSYIRRMTILERIWQFGDALCGKEHEVTAEFKCVAKTIGGLRPVPEWSCKATVAQPYGVSETYYGEGVDAHDALDNAIWRAAERKLSDAGEYTGASAVFAEQHQRLTALLPSDGGAE